jgi:hypothetical protein
MHGALASEAHAVERDFGVDVLTVVFRPDHAASRADDAPSSTSSSASRQLVAVDMSAMGPAKLAVHAAQLWALRATLVRQVQGTMTEKKQWRGSRWSRDRSPRGWRGRAEDFKGRKKEKSNL